jgi:hypothetical protein
MNQGKGGESLYEKEQRLYFKYIYGPMFEKLKGLPYWKQLTIVNKALLTDPAAPTFTVFSPPGMHLATAPAANNNSASVSSMGIRFPSRGGTRRRARRSRSRK